MSPEDQKNLTTVSVSDLMAVPPQASMPVTVLSVGNDQDFIKMTKNCQRNIAGIMWTEHGIDLVSRNQFILARYEPILSPIAVMFLEQDDKHDDDEREKIWEGNLKPVQFTKENLLKFLKTVEMVDAPEEIINAIKNMRVLERKEQSDTISLEGDTSRTVLEETQQTNIPKRFSLMIPVSDEFVGKFEFEARVAPKKSRFGEEDKLKKMIHLRLLNARQVLRTRMESIVKELPEEIPRYYGTMDVRIPRDGKWV